MAKNIVIFSDGTGQEGGKGNNTNIYKLFNMIENRTTRQIAFYDRGLGTGWRKVSGSIMGVGISKNIRDCYQFLFENYQAGIPEEKKDNQDINGQYEYTGDRVFLFGFSRGAFTIRRLAGFINMFGILPKSRKELIKKAYKIYTKRTSPEKRQMLADEFLARHHYQKCPVKFVGVYDTVRALGIPFKGLDVLVNVFNWYRFHNNNIPQNVENGCQALSIDDERKNFLPTFWNERAVGKNQNIEQVWFPGMHTDVGGGYKEQELSDIVLEWMIKKAKAHGLLIYPWHKVKLNPDVNGTMHNSRGTIFTKTIYRRQQRFINDEIIKPIIHQCVLDRQPDQNNNQENKYNPWILKHDYDIEPW